MKLKFALGTKIWLSLSILVIAYFITVMLWYWLGQHIESQLNNIATVAIPKANQIQHAQRTFDEQVKSYQTAIMTGEPALIDNIATPKALETRQALQSIMAFNNYDPHQPTLAALLSQLESFAALAEQTYPKMSAAFEGQEENMQSLEAQAFELAEQTNALRAQFSQLASRYATALTQELAHISNTTRRQGNMNMIMFATVVLATLLLTAFIINRSILQPIQRLVEIAKAISTGSNPIEWLPKRQDEIDVLNQALRTMTENLTAAEKKYRGIFENALEGIFQLTQNGDFISANPAMMHILGYDSQQHLSTQRQNLFSLVDRANSIDIRQQLTRAPIIDNLEICLVRPDNNTFWGSLSIQKIKLPNGEISHLEGSFVDLSERIKKEHAERAREVAETINQKIMESIRYAELIQRSLLPATSLLENCLLEHFIIWQPRDIVGGDIVFFNQQAHCVIFAVADCTGHGIPGALMSMIASSGLRRITQDEGVQDPAKILSRLNYYVKASLQQDTGQSQTDDGMDVAICAIDLAQHQLIYAGARIPLIYCQNGISTVIPGNRASIGYPDSEDHYEFTTHTLAMKDRVFFMATDGYADQVGGEKQLMYGNKRLRKLLETHYQKPLSQQQAILMENYNEYKANRPRQDDVTVVGFRL